MSNSDDMVTYTLTPTQSTVFSLLLQERERLQQLIAQLERTVSEMLTVWVGIPEATQGQCRVFKDENGNYVLKCKITE